MIRRRAIAAAAFCAATAIGATARADDEVAMNRVVIAGPKKDPLTVRLEKEVTALGFEPIVLDSLSDCARAAVVAAVAEARAGAALCSDGDQVGVWTPRAEGQPVELRDVVAPEAKGTPAREEVAMRAAEIMRANVALLEPEPEPEPEPPSKPKPSPLVLGGWEELEREVAERPVPSPLPNRAARFTMSAGMSVLASTDATASGLSFHAALGVYRAFAVTAHLDAPISGAIVPPGSATTSTGAQEAGELRVFPGIGGLGFELPLASTNARFIPRVGAALGVAWIHATRSRGTVLGLDGSEVPTSAADAGVVAPAGWATASLSIKIYGPVRAVIDGLVGTAAGRLTVRDQGVARAHWGTPLGGLALRLEVLVP